LSGYGVSKMSAEAFDGIAHCGLAVLFYPYTSRGGHVTNFFSSRICWGVPTDAAPVPAGRIRQDLAALDDRELLGIVGSLPRSSQRRVVACELLVGHSRGLVWSCVQRYRSGSEPAGT